jgi:hypothetical protein
MSMTPNPDFEHFGGGPAVVMLGSLCPFVGEPTGAALHMIETNAHWP